MQDHPKTEKVMGKGTIYLMVMNVIFLISGYAIHFGLGRYLGPELYGVFGVILALLAISEILLLRGVSEAVTKFTSEDEESASSIKNKALKIQAVFSLFVFIFLIALAPIIADRLNDLSLVNYIRLSAFIIPVMALYSVYAGHLNGIRAFVKLAKTGIVYSLTKVFAVFALVFIGLKINGAIIGYLIAALIGLLVAKHYCVFKTVKKNDFKANKLIKFAAPLIIYSIGFILLMNIDLLFVKALVMDNAKTGFYTSATTLARTPYFIFLALSATLLPSISKSTTNNDLKLTQKYINQSLRYMLLLLIPGALLVSATSNNLISLVYTARYVDAAPSLSILIFGLTFLSIFVILTTIITASGKPKVSMIFALILVPIDIVLNLTLIPIYELKGAALATTITAFIGLVIAAAYVFKRFGTLMSPISVVRISGASLIIYFVALSYPFSGVLLVGNYVFLFLVYLGLLWVLRELNKGDIEVVKNMIPVKMLANNK
jgi:O-antigen/teichoic acid export membrane protein